MARVGALVALSLGLAHCSKVGNKYGVAPSARVIEPGQPVPKGGGTYRVGKPYVVAGQTYTPEENPNYNATGLASWYGEDFHGRLTANGEVFDMNAISAAHPTLPMPSYVRVTNLNNRRSMVVRVNDRGPYHQGRVIDVSVRAAKLLGFFDSGTTRVKVEYVGRASLDGSDDAKLVATLRHGDTPAAAPVMVATRNPAIERPASDPRPPIRPALATTSRPAAAPQPPSYGLAAAKTTPLARTATADQPASFESRFGPSARLPQAPAQDQPVSAYAPAGVLIGRGLY